MSSPLKGNVSSSPSLNSKAQNTLFSLFFSLPKSFGPPKERLSSFQLSQWQEEASRGREEESNLKPEGELVIQIWWICTWKIMDQLCVCPVFLSLLWECGTFLQPEESSLVDIYPLISTPVSSWKPLVVDYPSHKWPFSFPRAICNTDVCGWPSDLSEQTWAF